jgi:endonuclease/exonuclease/phosphatase family metal-dependent hydrolase
MRVSILQWNIWYKEDIGNIATFLKDHPADIICLQELTRDYAKQCTTDTPQYISEKLGYNYFAKDMHHNDEWIQCNAVFSRFPIVDTYATWVNEPIGTGGIDDEYRAYVEATLDIDGVETTVGTTHMSYTHKFITTARKEGEADKLVAAITRKKLDNILFAGDLNAAPDTPTIQKVSSILKTAGPIASEKSWATKPFSYGGFEETELNWRLDYIFVSKHIKVLTSEILTTEYSDHLPVLAVVEVGE